MWFRWALAVYFVLPRIFARTRVWPQLLSAAGVSAVWLSGVVPDGNLGWNGVPKYYLFFLLGAHCRQPILWIAQRCRGGRVLTGGR